MKNRHLFYRFGFALDGLRASLQSEKSVRLHVMIIAAALLLALVLGARPVWWAVIFLAAGFMLATELVNTAVEKLADHVQPEQHPDIKFVKDVLAAAVLVSCIAAGGVLLAFLWIKI